MKNRTLRIALPLALGVVAILAAASQACFMRSLQPVQVWLDHIEVTIKDQVAVKTYNCTFKNPNPVVATGNTCYMELEPGAQVDDMSVLVDGKEYKAEILDVAKAKEVFNDIVKRGGSPALLEYYGNQLIQTQVPNIPPGGTVTVKLTYTTVLEKRGGVVRLQMLNTNPKASMQPLKSASVSVKVTSTLPIKNIYSPTHKVKIEEVADADVMVTWSQENYLAKHPFVLYYQVADEAVGASLLTHRELGEEGHFMLMLSPTIGKGAGAVTESQILPKDVVFCVDTSGSMLQGDKMEQARAALKYCVEHLRSGDRFNIVDFSTGVRVFRDNQLVEVNETTLASAQRYVKKLAPRGGTAIEDALKTSLELLGEGDRLKMILFATDGLPTIGERDPEAILRKMAKANKHDVRIFVFGEGYNVNTKLLDFLALNHRGEADYVLPEEDIAKKISAFYDRVGSPVMTDLRLDFSGVKVDDVLPRRVSDIYRGEQVIIFGRYNSSGKHQIKVTANLQGKKTTLTYDLDFPEYSENDKNAFVPRLWAGKKVDFLLSELRKSGKQDPELVEEVTYLAKRYGIVTPYTSYLMAEDIVTQQQGKAKANQFLFGKLRQAAATPSPTDEDAKAERVLESRDFANARKEGGESGGAGALYDRADKYLKKHGDGQSSLTAIRYIGARTFYRSGGVWYDSQYDAGKMKETPIKSIKVRSKEYFELLGKHARVAKYLALGEVVLKVDGKWYRFESTSK